MVKLLRRAPVLLHGEHPSVFEIALVYGVGTAGALLIVVQNRTLTAFQTLILFILALDVLGGVIANSTHSTNQWYHERPVQIRLLFVIVHFVHPLLAVLVIDPGHWAFFACTYLVMLVATFIVLLMPQAYPQRPTAFAFFLAGVLAVSYFAQPIAPLVWFAPAYLAKLIVCFSVDHYGTRSQAVR